MRRFVERWNNEAELLPRRERYDFSHCFFRFFVPFLDVMKGNEENVQSVKVGLRELVRHDSKAKKDSDSRHIGLR